MTAFSFKYNEIDNQAALIQQLRGIFTQQLEIVIVCVGSDRTVGDSLGPLVGTLILEQIPTALVYGSLSEPVHALNLLATLRSINKRHPNAFVLAVDASLGKPERIGMISFRRQPLLPGSGLKKILPKVGHASLIGIVNSAVFLEHRALKNTRVRIIYSLAKSMAEIITQALSNHDTINQQSHDALKHPRCRI